MLVICNGMERSGSTLQYNITRLIVESKGLGRSEGYPYKGGEWESGDAILQQWRSSSDWIVIKAHSIHPHLEALAQSETVKILYIFRDIRDVAASCKEFLGIEEDELLAKIDEFLDRFEVIIKIKPLTVQRYSSVVTNSDLAVRQIASVLKVSLSCEEVEQIVKASSINTMEKEQSKRRSLVHRAKTLFLRRLMNLDLINHIVSSKELINSGNHISSNKGKFGTFRQRLSPTELASMRQRYLRQLNALKNSPYAYLIQDEGILSS